MMKRIILWLCSRYNIWPIDETRTAMDSDKQNRSRRWEEFAKEEGGIYDMIEAHRREAFEAYSALPPNAHDERVYLAMTDRNLRALKRRVDSVIATGKIEARNEQHKVHPRILKSV